MFTVRGAGTCGVGGVSEACGHGGTVSLQQTTHVGAPGGEHQRAPAADGGLNGVAAQEAGVWSQSLGHLLRSRPQDDASTRHRASLTAHVGYF